MKFLLVMGLPRGGTSPVAAVAHALGIPMLLPDDPANRPESCNPKYPLGNFEDRVFRNLVWQFTETPSEQSQYEKTTPLRRAMLTEFNEKHIASLDEWIAQREYNAHNGWFGVKMPVVYTILQPLLPYLQARGHEVTVIRVIRTVSDAAKSLAEKRGHVYAPRNKLAWATAIQSYHQWRLDEATHLLNDLQIRLIRSDFWQLRHNPLWSCRSLAAKLYLPFKAASVEAIKQT